MTYPHPEDEKTFRVRITQETTISPSEAKDTIKQWLLQTTPAPEALLEATAGIENEFKFRRRINRAIQITKELGDVWKSVINTP